MPSVIETSRIIPPHQLGQGPIAAPALAFPQLDFKMQHQNQRLWCWAATALSVASFYRRAAPAQQCALVNQEFNIASCCANGRSALCNRAAGLKNPLDRMQVLDYMRAGDAQYQEVITEVNLGHPLPLRINWTDGGFHFAVICGYRINNRGVSSIAIQDPWFGYDEIDFDRIVAGRYHGTGGWSNTYFTQ